VHKRRAGEILAQEANDLQAGPNFSVSGAQALGLTLREPRNQDVGRLGAAVERRLASPQVSSPQRKCVRPLLARKRSPDPGTFLDY
jgi:hypothetical protein